MTGNTDFLDTDVQQPNITSTLDTVNNSLAFSANNGQLDAGSTTTGSSFFPRIPPFLFCSSININIVSFNVVSEMAIVPDKECNTPTLMESAADTEFHHTLVKCTRNVLLIWIIDQINSVRGQTDWKRMRGLTLNPTVIDQYNKQHRKILEALYRREPEAAANSMKEHLETVRLSLTRAAAA